MKNNKAKIIIYIDYELQQGADMCSQPKKWGLIDYKNTYELLELLKRYRIKVCFATLGKIAEGNELPYSNRNQIKKIHDLGHEIASHSYYHFPNPKLSEKEIFVDLVKSKRILESIISDKVVSYVPPRNLPYNFMGIALNLFKIHLIKNNTIKNFPFISKITLDRIYYLVSKAGYKTYREYDVIIKEKANYKKKRGLNIIKLNTNLHHKNTLVYIRKNLNKKEYITVYSHPHSFKSKNGGNKYKVLIEFLQFIKRKKLDVILPKEII